MNQRLARPVYGSEWEGEQKRLDFDYDFARAPTKHRERSTSTTDDADVFISEFACVLIGCVADLN